MIQMVGPNDNDYIYINFKNFEYDSKWEFPRENLELGTDEKWYFCTGGSAEMLWRVCKNNSVTSQKKKKKKSHIPSRECSEKNF